MNTKLVPCTQLNCTIKTLAPEGTISTICKSCLDRVLGSGTLNLWVQQDDYESDSDDSDDDSDDDEIIVSGIFCKDCGITLPPMTMSEHLDVNNPKNRCKCDEEEERTN